MTETDLKEFELWKRSRRTTALEHAFDELEDLIAETKYHHITMPMGSFKILATALKLLKNEFFEMKEKKID